MATSRARAVLDAWLAHAEGLLAEQRSRSISPSSYTGSWSDDEPESTQTVREVAAGLEVLLARLTAAPGRWIFAIEDARRPSRYVQFLCHEDGSLICEVASNYYLDQYLDGIQSWTEAQKEKLGPLGWVAPPPDGSPNWSVVYPTFSPPVAEAAKRATRTLREVFDLADGDELLLKLFSSPNRGRTPASEVVRDAERPVTADRTRIATGADDRDAAPSTTTFAGDEPWADYYRAMYPRHAEPASALLSWKYRTSAVGIAKNAWTACERAREDWCARYGADVSAWPLDHPPVVLWLPLIYYGACLRCTWIDVRKTRRDEVKVAGREARKHAISMGADPGAARALRIPVVGRVGVDDRPPRAMEV